MIKTKILNFIAQHQLIAPENHIIVGLSGGADSVFLLHLLHELRSTLNLTLTAAHLDHEWRTCSADDAAFCNELAESLAIPIVSKKLSELAGFSTKFNGSKEAYARSARRFFFQQVRQQYDADTIALAHHADDQQETFFIRLVRGASLSGLCSMQVRQGHYIRPLLATPKKDILAYLAEHSIPFVEDETNSSFDYLRNRIRHSVLPAFAQADVRAHANMLRSISQLQQAEECLEEITHKSFHEIAQKENEQWHIDAQKLLHQHAYLRHRLIMYWFCAEQISFEPSQGMFEEIVRFITHAHAPSHTMPHRWIIEKKRGMLTLRSLSARKENKVT